MLSIETPAVEESGQDVPLTIDVVKNDVRAFVDLRDPQQLGDVLNEAISFANALPDELSAASLSQRLAELPASKALAPAALTVLVWAAGNDTLKKDEVLDHINRNHPALRDSLRIALPTSAGVHVADLSEKRPSITNERYNLIRTLEKMPTEERKPVKTASEQARLAGRHGSWAEVMKSWDAAESRGDPAAALAAAYSFKVYDDARKLLPLPAPVPKPSPTPATPANDLKLGKIQQTFVARVDRAGAADLRAAIPNTHRFEQWPLTPGAVLKEWNAFTAVAVQKYKDNGRKADPESEKKHLAFAMSYVITNDAPASSPAELEQRMKRYIDYPLNDPPKTVTVTMAPPAPAPPAPAAVSMPRVSPKDKALRHFELIAQSDREQVVTRAAAAYGAGPEKLEKDFSEAYTQLREQKADPQAVIALAVATTVPPAHSVRATGAAMFAPAPAKPKPSTKSPAAMPAPEATLVDKKSVDKFVKEMMRAPDPLAAARQQYANAALRALAPDLSNEKTVQTAVQWAHVVGAVQSQMPTDWSKVTNGLLDDE